LIVILSKRSLHGEESVRAARCVAYFAAQQSPRWARFPIKLTHCK